MSISETFGWRGATYRLIPTVDGTQLAIVRRANSQRAGVIPRTVPDAVGQTDEQRARIVLERDGDPTRSDLKAEYLSPDLIAELKAAPDDLANAHSGSTAESLAFWLEEGKIGSPLGITAAQLREWAASAYRLATEDRAEQEQEAGRG